MAKTVAQVGRKGTPENQGGEEAQQDSVKVANEDSATPEEEEGTKDTTADINQREVDDGDIVGVHPMWSEAAKESYLKNKSRFYAIDPKLVKGLLDFHNLCKMSEFDFEVELNRRFQEQKEWDDYNAAFTIAQEQLRVPELSRRETRLLTRSKEQAAMGKTADPVSMPKPLSSPGKAKAGGGTVSSPGKAKARGGKLSSPASSSDEEDESYSSASSVSSSSKEKKRNASSLPKKLGTPRRHRLTLHPNFQQVRRLSIGRCAMI
jgi:hypothetical protein